MNDKDKTPLAPNHDSGNDFAREMLALGVKPMDHRERLAPPRPRQKAPGAPAQKKNTEQDLYRQKQAAASGPRQKVMSNSVQDWLNPHDIVEYRGNGLQHNTFKDFKQGKIRPTLTLDLHGHTVEESRQMLIDFLHECQEEGVRCALVMHGKGYHTRMKNPELTQGLFDSKAVATIKSYVVHWLQQLPEVLALSSAQPKDGGTGALYVLLRSELHC